MKKIVLCIALLLGFSSFLVSNSTEAQASANSELKSIKKYAAKGTVKGAKGIKIGSKATDIKKKMGKTYYPITNFHQSFEMTYKINNSYIEFYGFYSKDGKNGPIITSKQKVNVIQKTFASKGYTYSQITKVLGKPYGKYYDNKSAEYQYKYKVGKWTVTSAGLKNNKYTYYSVSKHY